jgi:uncharacterized protein YodC (DUF2158 family)
MERKIKQGDIVWLKSGGLPMTVATAMNEKETSWRCHWFDENNEMRRIDISADALTLDMPEGALVKDSREPIGFKK